MMLFLETTRHLTNEDDTIENPKGFFLYLYKKRGFCGIYIITEVVQNG